MYLVGQCTWFYLSTEIVLTLVAKADQHSQLSFGSLESHILSQHGRKVLKAL